MPARSIRVIDLGAPGAGAQSEPILAVSVEATRGRLVVGRAQTFLGGGRSGAQVTLASPALRDQWWFADGAKGSGVSERFSIYNPSPNSVEVDVLFIGIPEPVLVDPLVVPPREVITFDPGPVSDLQEGRHATVFATQAEPVIVVERAISRTVDDTLATSVAPGATPRQDAHVARIWYVGRAPDVETPEALVIYNADNSAGTVTVRAVGSSGPVEIEGLTDVDLPGASIITIDLVDPVTFGRQIIVESTSRVFVERSFPTGRGSTRSSSWAVPAS